MSDGRTVYNWKLRSFDRMLPLLPALILLLLQGPSNFERLAVNGRLPAALEAMHRQMAQPGEVQLTRSEEQALASLIAGDSSVELSQALLHFLRFGAEKPQQTVIFEDPSPQPIIARGDSPPQQDGFSRFQRTRDGPATLGAAVTAPSRDRPPVWHSCARPSASLLRQHREFSQKDI